MLRRAFVGAAAVGATSTVAWGHRHELNHHPITAFPVRCLQLVADTAIAAAALAGARVAPPNHQQLRQYSCGTRVALAAGKENAPSLNLGGSDGKSGEGETAHEYDYDLIVIGGGSGGLAAAKQAAAHGARVALCDFVTPSPYGTTWGLGGTCVNVGCIPKKLMHHAALQGHAMRYQAPYFGWGAPPIADEVMHLEGADRDAAVAALEKERGVQKVVDWQRLRQNVVLHIQSLNFGYLTKLRDEKVKYINALASFIDEHTVECVDRKGKKSKLTAKYFIIATGGRPTALPIEGAEHAITSDDLFRLKDREPGPKTLVVGAGYIALECAGMLQELGFDATVMSRSTPLRVMDQQMAKYVTDHLESDGVKIWRGVRPTKIEALPLPEGAPSGARPKYRVHFEGGAKPSDAATNYADYDCVVAAIGRSGETAKLNLEAVGIPTNPSTRKIIKVDCGDRTVKENIFAVGDVVEGIPELTPVAIRAGKLLANRLFGKKTTLMDYKFVPTTVFTNLEYGFCGYSEEEVTRIARSGDAVAYRRMFEGTLRTDELSDPTAAASKNLALTAAATAAASQPECGAAGSAFEVYLSAWTPLEWTVPHLRTDACLMKVIVEKESDRVVGFHVVAPNAGEITQGIAAAMRCGLTKERLDSTVGIHPTDAENMVNLDVTKASGESFIKGGC